MPAGSIGPLNPGTPCTLSPLNSSGSSPGHPSPAPGPAPGGPAPGGPAPGGGPPGGPCPGGPPGQIIGPVSIPFGTSG